jgi:glycosyltransferase involved in cell wall biosynthesis
MTQPLISCIVPVFNGEHYLGEALESILNQTYRPLEIIVADDGSTDGTAAIAARYGTQVRYLWQSNSGPGAARNLGLTAALGEFVAFLDADDLWHPGKLERQMARFQAHPELDLCVTYVQNFLIPELHEQEERFRQHRLSQPLPGYVTQTLLARRTLFHTVGQFNSILRLGEDTDWFLRAAEHGTVMELLPDVLVYRRLHESNLSMETGTRRMTSSMETALFQVMKASLDRRRRKNPSGPVFLEFPISRRRKNRPGSP